MRMLAWLDRRQALLYLAAIALAAALGLTVPQLAPIAELAVEPALIALLTVTFLAVPFRALAASLGRWRFGLALLLVNFVAAPLVAYALSRLVAGDQALVFGVLLVLLAPCIDYVIVFTRLAGGAAERLLAATPLLMVLQLVLLPVYLLVFVGADAAEAVDPGPLLRAFALLVLLPLGLAIGLQLLATRSRGAGRARAWLEGAMVPSMVVALLVIVLAQVPELRAGAGRLLAVVPVFVLFAVIMPMVALLIGRMLAQSTGERIALAFSGATRNSLVVLPLAIALPPALAIVPAVVVTQTFVELVLLVVASWAVPRGMRHAGRD